MGSNDGTNQNIELENKFTLYLLFTFFLNWICGYILNTKYIILLYTYYRDYLYTIRVKSAVDGEEKSKMNHTFFTLRLAIGHGYYSWCIKS
jgi:hypothetical protein